MKRTIIKMPKTKPYPVRLSEALVVEIAEIAFLTSLPFPDALRLAVKEGIPILRRKFKKE